MHALEIPIVIEHWRPKWPFHLSQRNCAIAAGLLSRPCVRKIEDNGSTNVFAQFIVVFFRCARTQLRIKTNKTHKTRSVCGQTAEKSHLLDSTDDIAFGYGHQKPYRGDVVNVCITYYLPSEPFKHEISAILVLLINIRPTTTKWKHQH